MPYHDVKQGETLLGLAVQNGLASWKDIRDRPENAELTRKRPDPGILQPGDKVFIPNRKMLHSASEIDKKHTFLVSGPKAWLRLAVKDAKGTALAGKKYELTVAGKTTSGELAADGVIERAVPVDVTEGSLTLWTAGGQTEQWDLAIGSMDPIDEVSGVQARLNNLGFACGELNDETKEAICAFQLLTGLEATGEIDDALRQKILSFYDPAQDDAAQQVELAAAESGESP